jgi:hypothetical protein
VVVGRRCGPAVTILSSRVVRTPFTGVADAAGAGIQLAESQIVRWSLDRSKYQPELWLGYADGGLAAALTTRRPVVASRKIVDIVGQDPMARNAVLEAIVESAEAEYFSRVTWELHDLENTADAARAGFDTLPSPIASTSALDGPAGAVLRFSEIQPRIPRHYKQTTEFTCGAVALAGALQRFELPERALGTPNSRRVQELALWRAATNFPACEPIGLAVAAQLSLVNAPGQVHVHLDTEGPVLLEKYTDDKERTYRAELQEQSLLDALRVGVQVHRDRIRIDEVFRLVDAGHTVLLLIDLLRIHNYDSPHWVAAVARDGDALLINDPWFDEEAGESWIDAYEVPFSAASLDAVVAWGAKRYRGTVVLPAA